MIDPADHLDESDSNSTLRVALAHDWLVARRGGELVLDAIVRNLLLHNHTITRLYTMFDTGIPITPDIDKLQKTVSPLSNTPSSLRRWLLFRYPSAVNTLSRQLANHARSNPIDLLISTHSSAIKALKTPSLSIPHISYCHTPARYLWSQRAAYNSPGFKGRLRNLGLNLFAPSLRRWDKSAANSVTHFIANSTHTAEQIKEHYDRDSTVIHPPVRTDLFTQSTEPRSQALLLVSALEPYKRVDLAIDAAAIADRPLNIVGSGSHESQLRKHASRARKHYGSNSPINFLGQLSDDQLLAQYQIAHAFLFPQIEDFGITAVEAQATGCPVVARKAGGALDTVSEGSTGSFFEQDNSESIADAINRVPADSATPHHCRSNALRFSEPVFNDKLTSLIAGVISEM
jgi:glycosyltransferase involved in cell wall biosynthesis